ncbi:MAG: lipid-A-disaccharide synthase [Candidatus Scalindua sp.]|nr:lipid-A-disaccharide synthase [Candidatus Scalindua sp.]MDV5166264.1 lipid-A-disaccharide synthase [Candidatus Scalindua sp.]
METKKIFISAGETSGDMHGSNLMREIHKKNPSIEFYGLGRNKMAEAGLQCIRDMSSHSVMWLQSLKKIPGLWTIFKDCYRFFDEEKPELLILIDYVGFNLYLARAAKKRNIPVMYYISPQLWAHGSWRIKKIKKFVDRMVVIYPFEETFYTNGGVSAKYVGHPLFDELNVKDIDTNLIEKIKGGEQKTVISLLPGSRKQEIRTLLPILLETATAIHEKIPSVKFLLSCSNKRNLELIESITKCFASTNNKRLSIEIVTEKISEVIKSSSLCICNSGTVTLEIANYQIPMVACYRVSPFAYFASKPHIDTPYICLVNAIAEREVVPEKTMYRDDYKWLASRATELLLNEEKREACIDGLKEVTSLIGSPGASAKAADEALSMI